MAIGIGTNGGVAFIASVVSEEVYDPVYDTAVDQSEILQVLPSFYRTFMEDQEVFTNFWTGFLQAMAAELLHLQHVQYGQNLRDVPVISQRKWVLFDLAKSLDFATDPGLEQVGQEDVFSYDAEADLLRGTWIGRAGVDRASVPLLGTADQDTSLSWSVVVNITSAEAKSAALFGYFNSTNANLANALAVAITGDQTNSEQPHVALMHIGPTGAMTQSVTAFQLTLGIDYRIDCTYTARTGIAVAAVSEVRALKASGTAGQVAESTAGSIFSGELSDPDQNFDTAGVVPGDILVVAGEDFVIDTVAGTTLAVTPATLPAAASVAYEVRGVVQRFSLELDIPGGAADPSFEVDRFGTANLDVRTISPALFTPPGEANRKRLVATTRSWSYIEPTVAESIIALPRLQDRVIEPTALLYADLDYVVEAGSTTGSIFKFQEPPTTALWAEYVGYDESFIENNFGVSVDLIEPSSDAYKAKVRGLFYAYFQGPRLEALRLGVHILVGLPIADVAGTVESINTAFSGTVGQIRAAGRDYLFPLAVGTPLSVGDEVSLFQPLSNGVEVVDYLTDEDWWARLDNFNELQKYHSFAVFLNLDAFDLSTLSFAANFVDTVKPTWKSPLFFVFKNLEDTIGLSDELTFAVTISLSDDPCDAIEVRYDSADFEGEFKDWVYDQGQTSWDATSAAMRQNAALLTGTAVLTNGSATITGTDTLWASEIGAGLPPIDNRYVLFALYTTGTAGVRTAGSNSLVDATPSAFVGVQVGDQIVIDGEGQVEVVIVTSDNEIQVDMTAVADASGLSWQNTGLALTWAEISNVASDTSMTVVANSTADSGTYLVYLLDRAFLNIYYDQFVEACPDERLVFRAILSPGFNEQLLTGSASVPASSSTWTGTGTLFTSELSVGDFIVSQTGSWFEVASTPTDTSLTVDEASPVAITDKPLYRANNVQAFTVTMTNSSTSFTASASMDGVINTGDFLQVVPTPNKADPSSGPAFEVASVSGTSGTLVSAYTGDNVTASAVIFRGISADLPSATLPVDKATTTILAFTDFSGAGSVVESELAEQTP